MEFGNFNNYQFVLFFVTMIIIVIAVAFMATFYGYTTAKDSSLRRQIKLESTTVRIYIIDVQKNRMVSFNKSSIKNKTDSDLVAFYNKFHPNDVEKVKDWIFSIFMGNDHDEYLEADILLNNGRKTCFSLLKLIKFNPETKMIHLESHVLKYMTPNNAPKQRTSGRKILTGIVKRSQIAQIINKEKSLRGFTFGIRFFYTKQKVLSNNKIEHHMLMTLKNEVYPFVSDKKNQRQILDDGENELFLFDLRIGNKNDAMQLANSISHAIKQQMEVNGFTGYISYSISVVENGQFYQDFDSIIESCREGCINGQSTEQDVVLTTRNINRLNNFTKYEEQVAHLFKHDIMRHLFRPIVDVRTGKITGYFQYVKAYDSPFSTFQEMSKYASRVGKNVDLFAAICKHVIPKFASENIDPNCVLNIQVSILDIDHVVEVVNQIPSSSNVKISFVFDEQEINENAANLNALEEIFKTIIASGFSLSLLLMDKDLLLDNRIYSLFDYFIFGSAMIGEIRKNNRIRLSAYTLVESLLKYNKPIIATDLESWQAVELIIESGIQYISTDVISPSNDMFLPIEKKKLDKVINMTNKYS